MTQLLTHLDAVASLEFLERKRDASEDTVHRAALTSMRGRLISDITGEIQPALDASDPGFSLTSHLPDGSSHSLSTPEEIRGLFESLTSDEQPIVLWIDFDHIVIEDRTFAVDGVTRTICPGAYVTAAGLVAHDADALYLVSGRVSSMVEFGEDGRLKHEVIYMSPAARTVEPLDHPDQQRPPAMRAAAREILLGV